MLPMLFSLNGRKTGSVIICEGFGPDAVSIVGRQGEDDVWQPQKDMRLKTKFSHGQACLSCEDAKLESCTYLRAYWFAISLDSPFISSGGDMGRLRGKDRPRRSFEDVGME
jgi:hypothetical protein